MHSITSRRARQGAVAAMILAAITLLSGCATDIDPLIAPDSADETAAPTSGNEQSVVSDLTDRYNALLQDYQNADVNLTVLLKDYGTSCIQNVQTTFTGFFESFRELGSGPLATIQGQAASGQTVDPVLLKEVAEGLQTAAQDNATAQTDLDACST